MIEQVGFRFVLSRNKISGRVGAMGKAQVKTNEPAQPTDQTLVKIVTSYGHKFL